MTAAELFQQIKTKGSYLCVGLDTDPAKLPEGVSSVFEFNKAIIEATAPYAVAFKINTAFYEAMGVAGWQELEKTLAFIPNDQFVILDAKRGDIGNTGDRYAHALIGDTTLGNAADAVTVAPYMGQDSVTPFTKYPGKWAIVLALTSNAGADDFQLLTMQDGRKLYEHVLEKTATWGTVDNLMFVTGATRPEQLKTIRKIVPNHFLLVPGVGAQGGSLAEVSAYGMNAQCGLLVNASRAIIYASSGRDYADAAAKAAQAYAEEMKTYLEKYLS